MVNKLLVVYNQALGTGLPLQHLSFDDLREHSEVYDSMLEVFSGKAGLLGEEPGSVTGPLHTL